LLLAGCATGTGSKWYAPATWFSHAPAAAADRARAAEGKAEVKVDAVQFNATHAAHVEFAKADFSILAAPDSKPVALTRRTLGNGLDLLGQVDPLTAAESAEARAIVADLLSDSAARVAAAEQKQQAAESEQAKLSRELTQSRADLTAAQAASDTAQAKLRAAFDRENALANQLRSQVARFWIAIGVVVLLALFALYVRLQLGGVGAALHAAGVPAAVMGEIDKSTSAVGQWMMRTGRMAAAKAEAVLKAKLPPTST
jgi:hypothetical protein